MTYTPNLTKKKAVTKHNYYSEFSGRCPINDIKGNVFFFNENSNTKFSVNYRAVEIMLYIF